MKTATYTLTAPEWRLLRLAVRWSIHAARQWLIEGLPRWYYDEDAGTHIKEEEDAGYDPLQQAAGFALQAVGHRLLRQINRNIRTIRTSPIMLPSPTDDPINLVLTQEETATAQQMVFLLLRQKDRYIRAEYSDASYGPDEFKEISKPWQKLVHNLDRRPG